MPRPYRLFISTGEVSGDLQGALLVQALIACAEAEGLDLTITALGGERMAQAGATLVGETSAIGSVGIWESLPQLWPTLRIQRQARHHLRQAPPDLVILIDYMGPNLSLGWFMNRVHPQIPVVYYIAPQEWVWSYNSRHTSKIVQIADCLLAIFPAEASYFRDRGMEVVWVGHPLLDQPHPPRAQARAALGVRDDRIAVALLPASRPQELQYLLPIICAAAVQLQQQFPQMDFWIPVALERYTPALQAAIDQYDLRATLVRGDSQTVLAAADLAITKSGTANLEIALLGVPQVVVYRLHPLTAWVARRVLRFSIPFMSPVNLVAMASVVPELLQEEVTAANIVREARALLTDPQRRQKLQQDYHQLRQALGEPGVCKRAAKQILKLLPS